MSRREVLDRLAGVVAQRGGGAHAIAAACVSELERMGLLVLPDGRPGRIVRRGVPRRALRHQVSAAIGEGVTAEAVRRSGAG